MSGVLVQQLTMILSVHSMRESAV